MIAQNIIESINEYEHVTSISMFAWKVKIYRYKTRGQSNWSEKADVKTEFTRMTDAQRIIDSLK